MTEDERRKLSVINTASGRAALRGVDENKFGSLEVKKNKGKEIYEKFKSVMSGESKGKENFVGADFQEGSKVFAKVRGFTYWPATVQSMNDDGTASVTFANGQTGVNALVVPFNPVKMDEVLTKAKFKKSGCHSREAFLKDVTLLGFD